MKSILLDLPTPLITPRLIIKPPLIGEGAIVNEAVLESFEVLHQFMPWAKERPSIDDSEEFVRQAAANWILKNNDEPYLPLFLFDKKTNHFIGVTGFHHFDWEVPCIETGYWIRTSSAGHGLMTEAINALTQYAFKQLRVKRMAITCEINNLRSKKLAERLGYHLESIVKANRVKVTGEVTDTAVFARYTLDGLPHLSVEW